MARNQATSRPSHQLRPAIESLSTVKPTSDRENYKFVVLEWLDRDYPTKEQSGGKKPGFEVGKKDGPRDPPQAPSDDIPREKAITPNIAPEKAFKDIQQFDSNVSAKEKLLWPKIACLIEGQVQRNGNRPGRYAYAGINIITKPLPVTNKNPELLHARDSVTNFKLELWRSLISDAKPPNLSGGIKVIEWATYTYPYRFLSQAERKKTEQKNSNKILQRIRSELQSEPHRQLYVNRVRKSGLC